MIVLKIKVLEIIMQTLTIKIKDDLVTEVMNVLEQFKDSIQITKDKNLELDPYFYERKEQLQKDMDDIDNGKIKMINNKDFWDEIDSFTESLQK
jgi:hypothetical protein